MGLNQILAPDAKTHFADYVRRLSTTLEASDWSAVERLAAALLDCWKTGRHVFIAGNGGSAGNANHLANDLLYPVSKIKGSGIRAHALSANPSVLTCLSNDEGYESAFAHQLAVLGREGDILLALSGSGNSPNIILLLEEAKRLGVVSYAIVGYSGGKAKAMADFAIHVAVDDMQIAEDAQMILGHMILQWLYAQRDSVKPPERSGDGRPPNSPPNSPQ
jgi:D-sedoheptulose 7-phosphate isomerase